jgi:hypothetical protein
MTDMPSWSTDDLDAIAAPDEVRIAHQQREKRSTTLRLIPR